MTSKKQKILGWSLRLSLLRFLRDLEKDAHEFFASCEERLYNLGLVNSYRVDYTTFQLNNALIVGSLLRLGYVSHSLCWRRICLAIWVNI